MKKFLALASLVTVFTSFSFVAAAANLELNKTYISSLNNFSMDIHSSLLQNVRAGYIQVLVSDRAEQTMSLTMYRPFHCPPGKMCAMMMPLPVSVQVAIQDIKQDDCGSVTYFGSTTTTEGDVKKVTLVDNTANKCPSMQALSATEITYEIDSANGQTSVSHMTGGQLSAQVIAQIQSQDLHIQPIQQTQNQ